MSRIMVVDDDKRMRLLLEIFLTEMGYEVVGKATTGEEAVQMARDCRPDLILMDIMMPGKLDGIAAARRIKERMDIPLIFLSAYAADEYIQRASEVKPFGYITKPFEKPGIKAAIEVALTNKATYRRLRHVEERYRLLLDTTEEGVCFISSRGKTTQVNGRLAEMLRCTEEELTGKLLGTLLDASSRAVLEEGIKQRKRGVKQTFDLTFRRGDTSLQQVKATMNPMYHGRGRYCGSLIMMSAKRATARKK